MRIVLIPAARLVPVSPALTPGPALVIDTLRATTTITAALAAGAMWVEPALSVAAARRRGRAHPDALLAGERHGDRLPGFDLGNSPLEVLGATGRGIILTTTNGTRASTRLSRHPGLAPVYAACLRNRRHVAQAVVRLSRAPGVDTLTVVCAGQDGHAAAEDLLTAGAVLSRLPADWARDDLAAVAEWAWRARPEGEAAERLALCPHGRALVAKGYADDVAACGRVDDLAVLPTLAVTAEAPPRFVALRTP